LRTVSYGTPNPILNEECRQQAPLSSRKLGPDLPQRISVNETAGSDGYASTSSTFSNTAINVIFETNEAGPNIVGWGPHGRDDPMAWSK